MQGGVCACVRRPPRRCQPCLRPPAAAAAPPGAEREGAGSGAGREGKKGPPHRRPALPVGAQSRGSRWPRAPTCRPASPTASPGICFAQSGFITLDVLAAPEQQASTPRAQPVPQGRQPIILPLLPKAEMRDLPGGEQPPVMEEDGVSAPSRDVGAFHVLLHQGQPWPLIFGWGEEKRGHFHYERLPSTAASGLPQESLSPPSPGHLPAGQEKR